ncbi:transcription antitermination factor NusB [Pararhizobium sp. IMCC21322]|uniref:transcription antitermination factor NusB n=1 Tax=Pararhizobium sp. IMCC21322 TaxID=3067903 RepID=UPI00274291BE|nr:transcription antitermination factor NusB [Pararhizobium sp. IMCC21322]
MSEVNKTVAQVRPANKRGAARLGAVQALYQMDIGGTPLQQVVAEFESVRLGKEIDGEQYLEADAAYFRGILAGVVKEQVQLDPLIHKSLTPDWPLARIDSLLRAVLRAATFEMLKRKDVPAKVIINEYVDVTKAYFLEDEPKMVNGVLDHIARDVRPSEFSEK